MVKKYIYEIPRFRLFWGMMLSKSLRIHEANEIMFTLWEIDFSLWIQGACCYRKVMSIFVTFFQAMGTIIMTLASDFLNPFINFSFDLYILKKS